MATFDCCLLPCHYIAFRGDRIGDCRSNESLMQPPENAGTKNETLNFEKLFFLRTARSFNESLWNLQTYVRAYILTDVVLTRHLSGKSKFQFFFILLKSEN